MIKKHQKGSLLIEMMAIISLLALVTPILFQQVHRRNEEILATQRAAEMRLIKEGVTNYLEANEDILAKYKCIMKGGTNRMWDEDHKVYNNIDLAECGSSITNDANDDIRFEIKDYISGMDDSETSDLGILEDYDIKIFGYTVPTKCIGSADVSNVIDDKTCEYRPELFAVIVEGYYSDNLRRKAKTASLIGAEGGVADADNKMIYGVQGSWSMGIDEVYGDALPNDGYATAVVTFFNNVASSSILKDVRWQHLRATTAQADIVAGEKVAATSFFTVGGGKSTNCITNYGTNAVTVSPSTIVELNSNNLYQESTECNPFFEVDSERGTVRIAEGRITTGVSTTTVNCHHLKRRDCENVGAPCQWTGSCVGTGTGTDYIHTKVFTCSGLSEEECGSVPGCVYYNRTCYACGEWQNEEVCRSWGEGCAWVTDADGSKGRCVGEYMLDPSVKSIMKDIHVTNDLTIKDQQGMVRSLVGSLPKQVSLGGGIACSYTDVDPLNESGGAVMCVDGDYAEIDSTDVSYRSAIGTRCSNNRVPLDDTFMITDEENNSKKVHGGIYRDDICERLKNVSDTTVAPCTPLAPGTTGYDPNCPTNKVACMDYCNKLGAICYKNNIQTTTLETIINNCPDVVTSGDTPAQVSAKKKERKACQGCVQYASICKRYCLESFPQEKVEVMPTELRKYIKRLVIRGCYVSRGKCEVRSFSKYDGRNTYAKYDDYPEYICSDPHYGYSLNVVISNLDRDSDANPGASYELAYVDDDNTKKRYKWTISLGGALGVYVGEYCVPYAN